MPGVLLVVLSLGFMLFRVVSPRGAKVEGKILRTATLTYRERLALQKTNLCSLAVILLLGSVGHWIRLPFEVLAIAGAYAVLLVPVRYHVTSKGIGLNRVVFRQWDEFARFETSEQKLALIGRPGNGRLTLWLRGRHQEDVLPLLRRYVHESGRSGSSAETTEGGQRTGATQIRRLLLRRS